MSGGCVRPLLSKCLFYFLFCVCVCVLCVCMEVRGRGKKRKEKKVGGGGGGGVYGEMSTSSVVGGCVTWPRLTLLAAAIVVSVLTLAVDAAVPCAPVAEIAFAPYNNFGKAQMEGSDAEALGFKGSDEDNFCFISHGCWGGKPPQKQEQKDVATLIAQLIEDGERLPERRDERIRFVLAAGDNFYPNGVQDVYDKRFFTSFEQFYGGSSEVQRVPWLLALGNHDHQGNWSAQVSYTHATKDLESHTRRWAHISTNVTAVTGRWYMPHAYYAIKVSKDMVVVVIDTVLLHNCHERLHTCWDNGKQKRMVEHWLLHRYASVPYKLVVGHYPILSNGPHENFAWLQDWLIPLMRKSCASIYIHADNHYLQVSKQGFQYYANSGGGAGLGLHSPLRQKSWVVNESVFHSVEYGVMVHCKKGRNLTHRVLSQKGRVLFSFVSWESDDGAALEKCLANLTTGVDVVRSMEHEEHGLLLCFPLMIMVSPLLLVLMSIRRRHRILGRRRL
ncbi:tartrate-resistant acid phosphatase type 5 precursor [Trypanosoma cruzi marinkellei]|uniref:acid phosphatase n=1 Tax=Trypanosoma cruzi marinkellei TaxID=85056 RepID=K2MU76_TRYCR|nr:tartrate-resistant acid phosphatase type 5 precursor [Trypanosoma cruzi marinkellei]